MDDTAGIFDDIIGIIDVIIGIFDGIAGIFYDIEGIYDDAAGAYMDNKYLNNSYKKLMKELSQKMMDKGKLSNSDILMLNPLVLAYVGDSVYDTFVRTLLVFGGYGQVAKLHKMSIGFVKAKAQADILKKINESLTPEEQDVVRRGRNAKSSTIPKNADILDYRYATGFETLIGFLYLTGQIERLMEIIDMIIKVKMETLR